MDNVEDFFGPVISRYTRAQAIEDGELVDVSEMAREAGWKFPVAVTRRVWEKLIVPSDFGRRQGQSEDGRLWDVLFVAAVEARKRGGSVLMFGVLFQMGRRQKPTLFGLRGHCGPGDTGEPVVTIMLPEED